MYVYDISICILHGFYKKRMSTNSGQKTELFLKKTIGCKLHLQHTRHISNTCSIPSQEMIVHSKYYIYIYRYTVTLKMHVSLAQVNRSKSSWQEQSFSTGTFIQKGAAFLEKGAFLFHWWHTFKDSMENTLLFKQKLFIRVCACMHLQSLNPYWL